MTEPDAPPWLTAPFPATPLEERFAPVFGDIASGAARRDRERLAAITEIERLRATGLFGLTVPARFGGLDADPVGLLRVVIALGRADSSLAQALRAHFAAVEMMRSSRPTPDRDRWFRLIADGALLGNAIQERSAAGPGGFETRLLRTADGLRLTGLKHYSTGSLYADWIEVTARTDDDRIATVRVRRTDPGVSIEDDWGGFGQRLSASGTSRFDAVPVDEREVKLHGEPSPHHLFSVLQGFHLATLVGIGEAVVAEITEYVRRRTRVFSHGSGPTPAKDPLVQSVLGELRALVSGARAAVLSSAQAIAVARAATEDGAGGSPEATRAAERETMSAQILVSELILRATTRAFDVGGASALEADLGLDRHWRNARTLASHNPVIYQSRAIGEDLLTGDGLLFGWSAGERKGTA